MVEPSRVDRIRGAILGAIVGDAFGGPLEGVSVSAVGGLLAARATKPTPWSYTDDGAMNIAVAESLVARGTIDPEHLLRRFAVHYEPARGFGRGMKLALQAFAAGTPWNLCAFAAWPEGSQGNGGAVRVTPIACVTWSSPAMFGHAVDVATRVTHTHHEAVSSARVHANALALALETPASANDAQAFLAELRRRMLDQPPWVDGALLRVAGLLERTASHLDASRMLGTSPFARESVFAALWAYLSSPATYEAVITSAARLGGDTDSICAMAGALAGARLGMSCIPPGWLQNLAHERPSIDELLVLCDDLNLTVPHDSETA